MANINVDEIGPVDYLVVGFPAEKANFSGEMASELKALIDSNTIRVLDLVMITKGEDGSVEASELRDADDSEVGELRALERDLAILLAEEDVEEIGETLEPGSAAAVLVWENTWAAPFGSAVRRSGGQLLANGRIPTQALIAAVEADRQAADERSMTMPLRDRGDRPRLLGRGHERRDDRRDDRGDRREDRRDDRGDRRDDRRDRRPGPGLLRR